jgi:hypothetical protein
MEKIMTRFQVNGPTGYVDYPKTKPKPLQINQTIEPMLPTGWQFNADGSISTPDDRLKAKKEPIEKSHTVNNGNGIAAYAANPPK